ncbi:BBE domain-containing protein, partial [Mycobacterium gordonae]|uniref:BBE domain-containing protein n=1 Tax=Mycobacterium gordonae TaxID=1778 RepID=UPI000A772BB1
RTYPPRGRAIRARVNSYLSGGARGSTRWNAGAETAWAYRDVNFSQVIVGVDPDPANGPALKQFTADYWAATHPYSAGGAYINFMMEEGQDRVRATYGPNYRRLTEIKAEYDPDNTFRVNQNIVPAR